MEKGGKIVETSIRASPGHGGNMAAEKQVLTPVGQWLKKLRFRHALLGYSPQDVWRKLDQLNDLYMQALQAERIRYDVLLQEAGSAERGTVEEKHTQI